MKTSLLKAVSVLTLILFAVSTGFGQANENTENSKDKLPTKKADKTENINIEALERVINAVAVVGGINLDIDYTDDNDADTEEIVEDEGGEENYNDGNDFTSISSGDVSKENPIKIFPNPMVISATIRFYNPDKSAVTLDIYNNVGQVVLHVPDLYENDFKIGKDVIPEGIYYVKIKKKNGEDDDDDDDDDENEISVRNGGSYPNVQVYTAKLVVN